MKSNCVITPVILLVIIEISKNAKNNFIRLREKWFFSKTNLDLAGLTPIGSQEKKETGEKKLDKKKTRGGH